MPASFEDKLLGGWEDVYKKGQLTLWVLLALKHGPKHMAEIKQFILQLTNNLVEADDKSMYRALRRFTEVGMTSYTVGVNDAGPDRKVYALTNTGHTVLHAFIDRNIAGIFYKDSVRQLLTP
ncbi:MAG TPA: PadR family transcriptional regulator [Candidatus Saccharimonadales bacterium]|nr:PadR family transcriptional regulator [Candidatus Saccharimonadales bacterium]